MRWNSETHITQINKKGDTSGNGNYSIIIINYSYFIKIEYEMYKYY